jgi:NitT/TauT family transport system permease protein
VSALEPVDSFAPPADAPSAAAQRRAWNRVLPQRALEVLLPVAIFALALAGWEAVVRIDEIPPYILPAPSVIGATLVKDWPILSGSLLVTLRVTVTALALATVGSVALAVLFAQSKWIERSFFPFAVVMQVTPVVSIAPLLLIYLEPATAVLVCAFLVAFFPILSNTALGLASADHGLVELLELYGATRWQQFLYLRLPAAMPYFLGGLRIGGGLALIGAIVAEIAAGSAGKGSGLAFRIVEAGFRLNIPRMFAALALISFAGILIYMAFTVLTHFMLHRWHDSARQRGQ